MLLWCPELGPRSHCLARLLEASEAYGVATKSPATDAPKFRRVSAPIPQILRATSCWTLISPRTSAASLPWFPSRTPILVIRLRQAMSKRLPSEPSFAFQAADFHSHQAPETPARRVGEPRRCFKSPTSPQHLQYEGYNHGLGQSRKSLSVETATSLQSA